MKIIVTGGRDYDNKKRVYNVLDLFDSPEIIQGGATGADALALQYAKDRGRPHQTIEANWDDLSHPDAVIKETKFGKKYDALAGHRRNQKMLEENRDAIVVAFPGGSGTADCVRRAKALDMIVLKVEK